MIKKITFVVFVIIAFALMAFNKNNVYEYIGMGIMVLIAAISVFDIEFHISLSHNYYEEDTEEN